MNYLVVVAHPDDEVLGAGATIKKLTRDGHSVDICIMCSEAKARAFRPDDNELNDDLDASSKMLGIRNKYAGNFPNIEMNNATHLSLVQFIEKAIIARIVTWLSRITLLTQIMIICIPLWLVKLLSVCFNAVRR